jgi:hypothetical protein
MNPTSRLHRYITGESMLVEREILKRTQRLDVIKPRTIKVWEPAKLPTHAVRDSRKVIEAGPNAPQLKRLIQHPYTQELARPRPSKPWRQPLNSALRVEPFGQDVRAAFKASERPRWPRVTRSQVGPAPRSRPTIDDFLMARGGDE